MSDSRLLLEITPKGILSFGDETEPIKLSSLNVLIGTNGSGKSNLIDVIGLLRAMAGDLEGELIENGGLGEWAWKGNTISRISLEILGHYYDFQWMHEISFLVGSESLSISREVISGEPFQNKKTLYFHDKSELKIVSSDQRVEEIPARTFSSSKSIITQVKDFMRYPQISELSRIYPEIRIYREWSFGRKNILRNPKPADSRNDYLAEDYSNLGLVLSRSSVNPEFKNAILENLRLLYQGLTDFNVLIQGGTTQIFLTEGKFSIPATRLSDGTLRYLCLLAILCDPKPPPLICIEEPELGLHPDILPSLAQLLVTAATRTQLIITTHSEILIDALTDYPEYVFTCEKTDGQTQIKRLDPENLKIWLEEYRLGQLWMRGQLGGTRW